MPFDYNQFAAKKPQENANGVQPVDHSSNLDNIFAEAEAELQKTNNSDTQVPKIDAPDKDGYQLMQDGFREQELKLASGFNYLNRAAASVPEGITRAASVITNPVAKLFGIPEYEPNTLSKTIGLDKVDNYLVSERDKYQKEIKQINPYTELGVVNAIKENNYEAAFRNLAGGVLESLPASVALMTLPIAGVGVPGQIGFSTALFGSGKLKELDEVAPDLPEEAKVINATVNGALEGIFETLFGSGAIGSSLDNILKKEGLKQGEKIIGNGVRQVFSDLLTKYPALSPFGEMYEEMATQVTQNITDKLTGVDPEKSVTEGMWDAGILGFTSGGLHGGMIAGTKAIANRLNKHAEKKQARANIEANLSPITNAKTGNVHAVKLRGQEKDEDEVYFVVDVDDDGFANIVDRQGNKVLDSEGKPYQNIEDFTTENVISREQILQGELQSLTQEQAAKEQAEAQTEREKNELAQIPEQLTIPNENGKEQKYVFAGEVRRNNPEKPNEITDFEVGLVDEFGEMPYDIAFLPAKTVYDYIKSQNESNEKELDQVLADAEKEVSAENSDQNGQNVTTAPSEDSNLSGKPVVTQKIGNADIDVIENEDHDEIVPSEKLPLEKALPLLEKKFKDNPKFEVVAEKERVEIPGRVIKGETKWDEDVVEPSTFKTVIKSVKIYPKEVLNQRRKEEQESKSFYQEQKKSILVDAVSKFNATPDSRSDKQKASEIEALATKLGYMTDRSPMNEIRIFNNKEGYVNIPKTAQPEKSGQINQLQTNENISNPDKLTTFKPEQQVNTPETTQPKATKPPTPKQIERAKLLKSEPNSAREVILKYFLSGGKVSPEMINRESIGRDRTGKLRSEGERRSMFWVTKQGEAKYTDQLEHILHGTPWENMLDDPTDFSNEVLDVLSLGTPSNMMAELKRLQSEQGSFDQQYSPEQVSEIEALAAQQAERERLDYEEQLQTVFEELFENQNISEQEIVNLFYTNNEENDNDQNEGRSGQASPENSTPTGDNPIGSIEASRGSNEGEESQTERFGLKTTKTVQDLSDNINSILEQYSGREMAAIQAEKYLNEFPELGQQYLNGNNITSRDELKSHLAKLQSKVREGKGKERQENKKQFKEQKTQQAIDEIEQMALAADAEMQKQIEESEYNETFENKEPEKSTETKQEKSVNKEDNNILESESSPKNETIVNQNGDFFTEIQQNIPTNDKIKTLEEKLARQKKLREQKVKNMNERNGLFGDAQADPRQIDLFTETFAPTQENFQAAIDKVEAEINSIKKEIDQERRVLLTAARENKGQLEIKAEQKSEDSSLQKQNASKEDAKNTAKKEIVKAESKVDTNPTEAQKEAGNYKMGHVTIQGLDITIENPKGSIRSGVDKTGKPWSVTMNNTYGYFKRTKGKDGDQIDVFLGDNPLSEKVFVIDQNKEDGSFDESKVMLGFDSADQAQSDYMKNYSSGWKGFGSMTESSIDDFKGWLNDGARQNKAYSEYVENKSESTIPDNPKNKFVNTEKLIQHILKNSSLKIGEEYTNEDGEKYRYDKYTSNYTNTPYWLSVLFYDAAKENGPEYSNQFSYNDYLFYFDRAKYKGQMDKKISISKLILLDKEQNQSVEANEKVEVKPEVNSYGANNKIVTNERAEELKKRLRDKLNNLNVGFDPELLAIGTELAAYHIESGARKFADFSKKMIEDVGEAIKPYLKAIYNGARDIPGMEAYEPEMTEYSEVKKADIDELLKPLTENNVEKNKTKSYGKQRVLQGNNKRSPKTESPSLFQGIEGEQRTGRDSGLQSDKVLKTNGEQQQPTGREGTVLPRNADLLEPALVEFNADENDTKSFNPTQKYKDNIAAIETVISLIREKRAATPQEKETLSKYVGFGGLKDIVLNPELDKGWGVSNSKYKPLVKRVIELSNEFNEASGTHDSLGSITGSILNAHFTPSSVIHAVYDGVKKLGFKGGQILEPSAGIGNFVTFMPNHIKGNSTITAVELDDLTGNILKYLHDDVNVKVLGIQDANIPNNSQDLVISNVPFGNYKIFDKAFKGVKEQFQNRIHNYFFAKAVDMARDGGLIAFVTSKGVMDAPGNEQLRRYLDQNTEFLGAVRLPNSAFKNNANTEVVTDIIFLKKNSTINKSNPNFINVFKVSATHKDGEQQEVGVNQYFVDHPENILGDIVAGGLYSRDDYTVENKKEYDLSSAITKALPNNVYTPTTSGIGLQANDSQETIDAIKEGNIQLTNGRLVRKQEGQLVDISINEPTAKIDHYITLRNSLMNLIYSEYLGKSDKEVNELRYYLNRQYDTFVKKYGKLEKSAIKIAKQDADGYNVLSLEVKSKQDGKADIFRQRTIQPIQNKLTAENIDEAIVISLYEHAKVDIERIAELMNLTIPEAIEKAKGKIFEEPTGGFVTRDEYLSGNVKQKLKQAQQAVENGNTEFQNNVDELQNVIPRDIPAMNIEARLGSRWIPQQVYTDFAQYLFNTPQARIIYQKSIDAYSHDGRVGTVEATTKYGTERRNGLDILIDALLINPPKIYDTIREFGQEKRVLNTEETAKAIEKYEEIRNKFEDWVYKSEDRRTLLSGIYNERFNTSVKRSYNGDHLNISGINGVKLRKHQKDAIWMLLQNNGGIIDHLVGAGKTYVMVAGTMEMKRTGVAKKPMIMALKSTIPQIVESYRNAFPMAKILAPLEKDFTKENRNKLFAQIANNEWDVIIMSHENYGKIPHEADIQQKFIEDEMAEVEEERAELAAAGEKQALKGLEIRLKNLEARLEKIANIDKDNSLTFEQMGIDHIMVDESQQFKNLSYVTKQRGVAGLSKAEGSKRAFNLFIGIRYLQQKYGADKGTTFLSGTPISNSMVEMYLLLKYLRPGKMNELAFNSFDAWATTFASPSSDIEFTVTGDFKAKTRFREFINVPELSMLYTEIADIRTDENTPLDKPKMKGGGYSVEEIKMSGDQIEYGKKLMEFARTKDGSHIGMTLSKNQETAAMLLATNLSSKMAIDMRMIDSGFSYDPNGKIAKLTDNVARIYNETDKYKGTQLIFSDLGTPKNKTNKAALLRDYMEDEMGVNLDTLNEIFGDTNEQTHRYPSVTVIKNRLSEVLEMTETEIESIIEEANHSEGSFNVYAEVKQRLIEKGVPAEQVVFIHDYNSQKSKEALFKEVQQGNIRIVLGSTQKLGTGVNVQDRVVAVHHLDVPWTPASMEQRNGRALRQGNEVAKEHLNNELPVYAYATERTLDAYKYQLLQTKQRFLDQVKSGEVEDRVIRESDGDSESGVGYAELVAMLSGNTDILTKSKLETKVNDLKRKKRNFLSEVYEAKAKIDELETRNPQIEKRIKLTGQNIKELTNAMQYDENGKMAVNDVDGKKLTTVKDEKGKNRPAERTDYAKEAIKIVEEKLNRAKTGDEVDLFTINGIKISGRSNERSLIGTMSSSLFVNASNGEKYSANFSLIPGAFLNNIQKAIENIPNIQRAQEAIVEKNKRDLKAYHELLKKGTEWEKEEELTQVIEELKEVTKRLTPVEEAKPEQTSEEKQISDNTIRIGDLSFNLGKEGFTSIAEAYNSKTGNTEAVVRINEQLRNEDYAKEVKPLIDLFNGEWNKSNKVILFGNLKDAANFKDTIDRVFGKVDQSIEEEYSPETEIKKETPIAPQVQKEPTVAKLLPVEEFRHTKTGQILYNVKINGRSDEYSNMVSVAKRYNPYGKQKPYNTFSKGFLFEKKEDAENFKNEVNNTAFNQNIANEPYSPYQNNGDVVNDSSETYEIYRYFDSKFVDYDLVLLKQGDFYEALGNSALNTSSVLGTVLTKRNDGKRTYNVTGFPSHNLETYLPKLRRSGLSVIAIDENGNIQTPSTNKTSNGTFNQAEEVQRTTEPNNGNGPSTDNVQRQGNTIPKNSNGEYKGVKGKVYQELKNLILTHKVKIFDSATFETLFNKLNTKKVTHLTSSPYNTFGNPFNIAYQIYNQLEDYNGENFNDPKELGFDEEDSTPLLRKVSQIGFYSTVENALDNISQQKGTPDQFKAMLLKNGAKQAELDWMGWDEYFVGNRNDIDPNQTLVGVNIKGTITKADIQNWIDQNKIKVEEVVKGVSKTLTREQALKALDQGKQVYGIDDEGVEGLIETLDDLDSFERWALSEDLAPSETKYQSYQEPGGSNYKELLLTMPSKKISFEPITELPKEFEYIKDGDKWGVLPVNQTHARPMNGLYSTKKEALEQALNQINFYNKSKLEENQNRNNFKSSHFDEPNILAHVRFNEREVNGERVLFLEEIQSDFSQAVRKGTTTAKTPYEKTDQWVNLALRRMMRYAAENGFDRIAWTNGEQQAARYDLSKEVKEIKYYPEENRLVVHGNQRDNIVNELNVTPNKIEGYIGKEASKKLLSSKIEENKTLPNLHGKTVQTLDGSGLKVGGEGMKAFYDAIVPSAANKLGKPFGARVENIQIDVKPDVTDEGIDLESGEVGTAPEGKYAEVQSLPVTDKMIESVSQGVPLFRNEYDTPIEAAERIATTREERAAMVKEVADRLSKKLNTTIRVVAKAKDLPKSLQRRLLNKGKSVEQTAGLYDPNTGNIYLVSDNIPSQHEAEATVLHEIVGHHGLRQVIGARNWDNFLNMVYDFMGEELAAKYANNLGETDPLLIADEFLAYNAQHVEQFEKESTIFKKTLAKLRELLRKVFPNLNYTRNDLRELILKSKRALERPKPEQFDNPLDFAEALGIHVKNTNEPAALFRRAPQQKEENSDLDIENKSIDKKKQRIQDKIEQTPNESETHKKRTILKQKIKDLESGWKSGEVDTKAMIWKVQTDVIEYAKKNMPFDKAGKSEINSLLRLVRYANNPKHLETVLEKIDTIVSGLDVKLKLNNIDKILHDNIAKNVNGKPQGTLDPEVYLMLDKIRAIRKLKGEDEIDQYVDSLNDDDIEGTTLFSVFGNLEEKSRDEINDALDKLISIVSTGKVWYHDQLQKRKKINDGLRGMVLDKVSGGQGLVSELDLISSNSQVKTGAIGRFINAHINFEWLLDKISKDKSEETGKGKMQEYFGDVVTKATNDESKGIREQTDFIHKKAAEIFGLDGLKLAKKFHDNTKVIKKSGVTYINREGERVEIPLSQNQAYKKWMEWQDQSLSKTFKTMGWDETTRKELDKFIFPDVKEWAEWQLKEYYPGYYEGINQKYNEAYFANLGRNENYSPIRREVVSPSNVEDAMMQKPNVLASVGNQSLKTRKSNINNLLLVDGDSMLAQHIAQMEHFKAWVMPINQLRSVFSSREVQKAIKNNHGVSVLSNLNNQIADMARGGEERANIIDFVDKVRRNFVTAELGANISLFPKQSVSLLAYLSEVPVKNYVTGMLDLALHLRKAIGIIKSNEMVTERFQKGWAPEIRAAMKQDTPGALSQSRNILGNLRNILLFPTKMGDYTAVIGGWVVYKYHYDEQIAKGKSEEQAHDYALNQVDRSVSRTQQSGALKDVSQIQKGSWNKVLTMFKSSPIQQFRYENAAFRNLINGRGSVAQNAKIIALYHIIMPVMFQLISNLFTDDDDDKERNRLLRAGVLGSFNSLMVVGDIIESVLEKIMGESWGDYSATPLEGSVTKGLQGVGNISSGIKDLDKEKILKGVDQLIYGINNIGVGLPYRPVKKLIKQGDDILHPENVKLRKAEEEYKKIKKEVDDWTKARNKAKNEKDFATYRKLSHDDYMFKKYTSIYGMEDFVYGSEDKKRNLEKMYKQDKISEAEYIKKLTAIYESELKTK